MVLVAHEAAARRRRGARATALYVSRRPELNDFDVSLLRRQATRRARALRLVLGARWRRTDQGFRHVQRLVVSEHCLGVIKRPGPAWQGTCLCPACKVQRAPPAKRLSCHRGLFGAAPTATWNAGVAYMIRSGYANGRVLREGLRRQHIYAHWQQ